MKEKQKDFGFLPSLGLRFLKSAHLQQTENGRVKGKSLRQVCSGFFSQNLWKLLRIPECQSQKGLSKVPFQAPVFRSFAMVSAGMAGAGAGGLRER